MQKFIDWIAKSQVYCSIFRTGWPDTARKQASIMISSFFLHIHPVKVRKSGLKMTYTFCLGGIAFLLFIILTITGILLMFYYRPTVEWAYSDMKDMEFVVSFGILLRNMHRWAAHGMVFCVWFHMLRVFLTGSYRPPREFNWVVGVMLLLLTLLLSFTGYLLPWDQLAYWAVTVGTNMARATPLMGNEGPFAFLLGMNPGNDVRFALLGGTIVGQNALLRFYVLHCIVLPVAITVLMALHFWRIRKDGGISGPL
jgi:quinol-cytochrome oxidoreductase complex cytochrome b subunit